MSATKLTDYSLLPERVWREQDGFGKILGSEMMAELMYSIAWDSRAGTSILKREEFESVYADCQQCDHCGEEDSVRISNYHDATDGDGIYCNSCKSFGSIRIEENGELWVNWD